MAYGETAMGPWDRPSEEGNKERAEGGHQREWVLRLDAEGIRQRDGGKWKRENTSIVAIRRKGPSIDSLINKNIQSLGVFLPFCPLDFVLILDSDLLALFSWREPGLRNWEKREKTSLVKIVFAARLIRTSSDYKMLRQFRHPSPSPD